MKLQWLRDNGYSNDEVESVSDMVVDRFNSAEEALSPPGSVTETTSPPEEPDDEVRWRSLLTPFSGC